MNVMQLAWHTHTHFHRQTDFHRLHRDGAEKWCCNRIYFFLSIQFRGNSFLHCTHCPQTEQSQTVTAHLDCFHASDFTVKTKRKKIQLIWQSNCVGFPPEDHGLYWESYKQCSISHQIKYNNRGTFLSTLDTKKGRSLFVSSVCLKSTTPYLDWMTTFFFWCPKSIIPHPGDKVRFRTKSEHHTI